MLTLTSTPSDAPAPTGRRKQSRSRAVLGAGLASLCLFGTAGVSLAQSDITQPGDVITATSSNSPGSEGAANAIDNKTTKYLNFDGANNAVATGFVVTPSVGATIVTGLTLQSANDAPERDPATYKLEGSNDGTTFAVVSEGAVPAFSDRFVTVRVDFANNAAYKAYRLTFPTTATSNGCCMQVAEVELLGTVVPPDVTQPGDTITATSSNSPGSEGAANAIDNKTTKYLNFDGANNAVATGVIVTPSVGATIVTGLTLQSANDAPERDPATYKLEGSNDGTTFAVVSEGSVPAFSDRFVTVQVLFSNTRPYKTYRLTFPTTASSNGCCMQVAEIELLGTVAPQDVTQPGDPVTATSSNSPGSEGVANAIDNKTTKYLNFDGANNAVATGLIVTPSVGKTIVTGLTLQSANDAPERDPATYKLEGSNDGTAFAVISEGSVPAFSDRFVTVEVFFENSAAYSTYRLTFPTTATANGCCMQVAEVELLGFAAGSSALPQFKTQPKETPVLAGASARFYVTVNGPWQVQWYRNGQIIPGANQLAYVTDAVTAANAGDTYYATAKNGSLVGQSDTVKAILFTPSVTKSVGLNFIGGGANGAPTAVLSTDIAGVHLQAYWNNATNSNGDLPGIDGDGNTIPLVNSDNADASPIAVNFASGGTWGTGTGTDNGNAKILNGYLDDNDGTVITFNSVPAGKHSVIVYTINRPLAFSDADYTVTDGNGVTSTIYIRDQNADEYNAAPGFVRGTSTDPSSRSVANYVRFDNVTSPANGTIILAAVSANGAAPVNAIQLLINPPDVGTPPQFSAQPASKNVVAGASATFTVAASGTSPLTYEWRRNGTKITDGGKFSGAGTASLTVSDVQSAETGKYTVAVNNAAGGVVSAAAVLSVYDGSIADRLVGHWTFDETTGLAAANTVAGGQPGALKGYAGSGTWGAGQVGGALAFDGASQFVVVPDYAKASAAVSVSAWVNAAGANQDATVIANAGINGQQGIRLSQFELGLAGTDGDPRAFIAAGPNGYSTRAGAANPLAQGTWNHLVLTADGGRLTLYRNGQAVGSLDYTGDITTATAQCLGIGGILDNTVDVNVDPNELTCDHVLETNPGLWTGSIDDVALWTRTLGAEEVAAIYQAGLTGKNVKTLPTVTPPVNIVVTTTPPAGLAGAQVTDVVIDAANKKITAKVPAGATTAFFTVSSQFTIKSVTVVGDVVTVELE